MEKQIEKITRFSKAVCVLLNVAIVITIVVGVFVLFAWLLTGLDLPAEIVNINGADMELPYLFKFGETKVFMPVIWRSGFDFSSVGALSFNNGQTVGFGDLLGVIFTVAGLRYAKNVFALLKINGSPFREEIGSALKKLTVVLLVTGFVSGVVAFLAAGVAWVLSLIFDYGRALQYESDTTL